MFLLVQVFGAFVCCLLGLIDPLYIVSVCYTLSMLCSSIIGLFWFQYTIPFVLTSAGLLIWDLRLFYFLIKRMFGPTYKASEGTKYSTKAVLIFYVSCSLLYSLYYYPVYLTATGSPTTNFYHIFGFVVQMIGIYIEAVADRQKAVWKQDKSKKGKFITTGFWKYSRHINYFGEFIFWFGLTISGYASASKWWQFLLLLLIPFSMTVVLFEGILMYEGKQIKKYGFGQSSEENDYIEYFMKTPMFFPMLERELELKLCAFFAGMMRWQHKFNMILDFETSFKYVKKN